MHKILEVITVASFVLPLFLSLFICFHIALPIISEYSIPISSLFLQLCCAFSLFFRIRSGAIPLGRFVLMGQIPRQQIWSMAEGMRRL